MRPLRAVFPIFIRAQCPDVANLLRDRLQIGPGRRTLRTLHKPGGRWYFKNGERERARRRRRMGLGE